MSSFSAGSHLSCSRCYVPWGKYGIHGTIFDESIGSAASHGCIRMYSDHIKELYSMIPIGTPVVIVFFIGMTVIVQYGK